MTTLRIWKTAMQHEMNDLWEQAPNAWECPACRRTKQAIVRRTGSGKLVGKIVCHHDHIYEHVRKLFRPHIDDLEKRYGISRFAVEEQVIKPIQCSAVSFFSCYVCEDCNAADPKAKKIVGAPSHVSFSPADIGRFSIPQHDANHLIDRDVLQKVWTERKEQFELRDRYIAAHVKMMVDGRHWIQARPNAWMFHGERPLVEWSGTTIFPSFENEAA